VINGKKEGIWPEDLTKGIFSSYTLFA